METSKTKVKSRQRQGGEGSGKKTILVIQRGGGGWVSGA